MKRRAVVTTAAASVATLAGCSALPMWDDSPEVDGGPPTADPEAEPGDGPDADYPAGYGPDGIEDADEALEAHADAFLSYDSYIFTFESMLEQDGSDVVVAIQQIADNRSETGYIIQEDGTSSEVRYFEDEHVYARRATGDDVEFESREVEYSMAEFTGAAHVDPLLQGVEYGAAEVFDDDEEQYFRYASEEVFDPGAVLRHDVDPDRVERFDAGVVVDGDGAVRHASFAGEVDVHFRGEMGVSEIDSANIDRPEWYDEADDA